MPKSNDERKIKNHWILKMSFKIHFTPKYEKNMGFILYFICDCINDF